MAVRSRKPKSVIPLFKVHMDPNADDQVRNVLYSGHIAQGPVVDLFERKLRDWFNGRPAITVNSGTAALDLALRLIGVGPGDDVITTPMTCTATNIAIVNRGARLVWADVDSTTGCLTPSTIAAARTPQTRAIMYVNWGGRILSREDFAEIRRLVPDAPVIQDCAHTMDPRTAEVGDYTAYSFQAIKQLTTGDGGALIVPHHQVDRANRLRWFGLTRDGTERSTQLLYELGFKAHMNDVAAAIGVANMAGLADRLLAARANADRFETNTSAGSTGGWFAVYHHNRDFGDFQQFMRSRGIEVSRVHRRNDLHPGLAAHAAPLSTDLCGVANFDAYAAAVPSGAWLTKNDLGRIYDALAAWI